VTAYLLRVGNEIPGKIETLRRHDCQLYSSSDKSPVGPRGVFLHKCLVGMSKHLAEAGNELGSNEQSFESVVSSCFFLCPHHLQAANTENVCFQYFHGDISEIT
jgi:hypothetical protein